MDQGRIEDIGQDSIMQFGGITQDHLKLNAICTVWNYVNNVGGQ